MNLVTYMFNHRFGKGEENVKKGVKRLRDMSLMLTEQYMSAGTTGMTAEERLRATCAAMPARFTGVNPINLAMDLVMLTHPEYAKRIRALGPGDASV
jgi:hypothetical protein